MDSELKVFCYLDNEQRPIATTLEPLVKRDGFAFLEVMDVGPYGAFLNWGLQKHLLVPFREQKVTMEVGKKYVVRCYLDPDSFRLVASSRIKRFLSNEAPHFKSNTPVQLLIYRKTPLGWEAIIENQYSGLLFESDVFQPLSIGERVQGYIKKIRPDNKIDLTLQPIGASMLAPTAELVFERLQANGGFLALHDKSSPDEIQKVLHLSKKAFKKAIGTLYKEKRILIKEDGIYLNKSR